MARLIPDIPLASINNFGEREAYRHLKLQLPKDWVVRYHYPLCWLDGAHLRDAEADFIIVAPRKGILVLEVKGSHGFESRDAVWYRIKRDGTREIADNPFEQAAKVKHRLVERIAMREFGCNKRDFPGCFGHAVFYPAGKVEGQLPSSVDPVLMITYRDIGNLHTRLDSVFQAWGAGERGVMFTPDKAARVVNYLSDSCTLVPVLASSADEDEQTISDLTRRQFDAFRGIMNNGRVHVKGGAGSGKTMIALWAAEEFSSRGDRVLLVCFNRNLAAWLKEKRSSEGAFEIASFFSLCRRFFRKAQIRFEVPDSDDQQRNFWTTEAPNLFCHAVESTLLSDDERFDAIIVDEAQDFHRDWWFPIQLLSKDPDHGKLYLFSDPEQTGIYGQGDAFPSGLITYELLENCRNTRMIAEYCDRVLTRRSASFVFAPTGISPEIMLPNPDVRSRARALKELIRELLDQQFAPSRIAVLSPWRIDSAACALSNIDKVGNYSVGGDGQTLESWVQGRCIWASTIKAFKGLEADCVVVVDIPRPGTPGFSLADLYVAASRAKHRLYCMPVSEAAAEDLRHWLDASSPGPTPEDHR